MLIGLVPIVGQVWFLYAMLQDGDEGENRYGKDPKKLTSSNLVSEEYTDTALTFTILWMILINLFYRLLPQFNPEYYATLWFQKLTIVINFIWSLLPILIAIAIRNKSVQIVLFVLGAMYLVYGWLQLLINAAESNLF